MVSDFKRILTADVQNSGKSPAAGFTLVELMAVVSIIAIITSVVIFSHREFNDRLEVTNAAYEIALLFREAQISGTAVRAAGGAGAGEGFQHAYGVYASLAGFPDGSTGNNPDTNSSSENKLVFFVDKVPNPQGGVVPYNPNVANRFECSTTNQECLSILELRRGVYMESICVGFQTQPPTNSLKCREEGVVETKIGIAATFSRPSPDAVLHAFYLPPNQPPLAQVQNVSLEFIRICLSSPTGKRKKVEVSKAGQILVGDIAGGANCDAN